jgi:AraC-like DNA-binding protein
MRKARKPTVELRPKSGVQSIHTIDETLFKSGVEFEHHYRPDHFTVIYLRSGEIEISYNQEDVKLIGPSIMFTVPDSIFILKGRSEDISLVNLVYSPDYATEIGVHMTGSAVRKFLTGGVSAFATLSDCEQLIIHNLMTILHSIINEPCPHEYNEAVIKNCFMALMFEVGAVLTKNIPVTEVRLSRKERLTLEFLELLTQNFYKERSVGFYAEKLHITARHLSATTKAVFGKSAGEMIDEIVIKEAKTLLQNPQYNIAQIADALNFPNLSFFGKFFKKRTGKSPSEYRVTIV